ncbi:MAG: hypothetical protein H7338_17460 [Candidatus Sericytochromatia bacterium]|nr:hypothetical protein [Candidatus Sericytochromatia bacterium]
MHIAHLRGLLATCLLTAVVLPAQALPVIDAGASLTEREGSWGYRVQATFGLPGSGLSAGGEWTQDSLFNTYAGTARYRFGTDWWGIWPLAGWRGHTGGVQTAMQGPEFGLGFDLSFSPMVPSLVIEGGSIYSLDGHFAPQLRINSRYRVLNVLDLDASYRLENWASWSQVWGLGAHFVW